MEKATTFGLPFAYRVLLPGAITVILLLPLLTRTLTSFGVRAEDRGLSLVGCVLLFGVVLAALDVPIYEAFEGRALWPARLDRIRQRRWQGYGVRLARRSAGLPHDDWPTAE